MRSRAVIGVVVGLILAAVIWWPGGESPPPPTPEAPSARVVTMPSPSPEPAAGALPSQTEVAQQGSPLLAELNDPARTAADDVETVRQIIGQYTTALQRRSGPPIGDNTDLVRALTGANPLRLAVLPPGHPAIDGQGRWCDRWGTPYHIHPLAASVYSVRSAGPDRRLFTEDDLVAGE